MLLTVNHLQKSFGSNRVLSQVAFQAESGSALGLLGRNGAGKTTTIRIIMQFLTVRYREQLLAGYGLAPEQIEAAMVQPALTHVETVAETGKTMEQAFLYTYLLPFLLYMTVMMYGQLVASSVASEKSNRAMEMLITSSRPMNLMFGKVIGSGLAGLTQIGLVIMAAMFISMFGMMAPESSWLTAFSFVPFIAPMAMFVRISMTDVPAWQIALSIAGMFLTIYGTGWLSSRIYRLGVLMYGKPPHLGELLSLLRQAGK